MFVSSTSSKSVWTLTFTMSFSITWNISLLCSSYFLHSSNTFTLTPIPHSFHTNLLMFVCFEYCLIQSSVSCSKPSEQNLFFSVSDSKSSFRFYNNTSILSSVSFSLTSPRAGTKTKKHCCNSFTSVTWPYHGNRCFLQNKSQSVSWVNCYIHLWIIK